MNQALYNEMIDQGFLHKVSIKWHNKREISCAKIYSLEKKGRITAVWIRNSLIYINIIYD